MSIPNFVETEWKSSGAAVMQISYLTCEECYASLEKDQERQNITTKACSSHSKFITCYASTFNVWEYETGSQNELEDTSSQPDDECENQKSSEAEKYQPWYTIFSPFRWFGYCVGKEIFIEGLKKGQKTKCKKKCDKNCDDIKIDEVNHNGKDAESCSEENLDKGQISVEEVGEKSQPDDHCENKKPFKTEKYQPWYAIFSPFRWFGYCLGKEIFIESGLKNVESMSLNTFVNAFKPTFKKSSIPSFSSESLCITLTDKCKDERVPYKNLIKIEVNSKENSKTSMEVDIHYMSEEDMDYFLLYRNKIFPFFPLRNEDDLAVEKVAAPDKDLRGLNSIPSDGSKTVKTEDLLNIRISKFEDWLFDSKIVFDDEDNQIIVPLSHLEGSFHRKIRWLLDDDYCLIRLLQGDQSYPEDFPEELAKYWFQRYRLFLRYDQDIKLDNESWFSVTPEMIAAHQALRLTCDVVVDAFCGAGSNAIQLAYTCKRVIAIDTDSKKIEIAKHNARVYGVANKIEFIQGDFLQLAHSLKADAVLLTPPWGGINYNKRYSYDVLTPKGPMKCKLLFEAARKISSNIALYAPKSSDLFQLIQLAGIGGKVDIEFNFISNKRKSITAYYGSLVNYQENNLS